MTCQDGTLFTKLIWEDYRSLRNNYIECKDILENFLIQNEGKYPNIRVVFSDIIQYISYAYMFSDHKNKGYQEQLVYLKRHKAYIWECQDYPEEIIIHMMAIAANMSFSMYSD
ncbi:unnamed protein product [marine sediment metagenome]|uniref:Uncharacterized protein n=1 Tax=marine sediment metagenome TaxID=412755 RepID=X0SUP0_9ZZZZ